MPDIEQLQRDRDDLARAPTSEDVREQCETFAEQTRSVLVAQTPAYAIVGGGQLALGQRADLALAYIVSQPGFVDYLTGEIAAAGIGDKLTNADKKKQLASLDRQIDKARAEETRQRIQAAKAEAAREVKRLEAELAQAS